MWANVVDCLLTVKKGVCMCEQTLGKLSRKVWASVGRLWAHCGKSAGKCGVNCWPTVQSSVDVNQDLKRSEVCSARISTEYCFYCFNVCK